MWHGFQPVWDLVVGLFGAISLRNFELLAQSGAMLTDDFTDKGLVSKLGTKWRGVGDQVMGGISEASISYSVKDGCYSLRMTGNARLENEGVFIQAALDLAPLGDTFDVSGFSRVRIIVRGNAEKYSVHLRTPDNVRPWQSFRSHLTAGSAWETIDLPFETFVPHRLDAPLDKTRFRRIGLVAIGRPFYADLAVSDLAFYR